MSSYEEVEGSRDNSRAANLELMSDKSSSTAGCKCLGSMEPNLGKADCSRRGLVQVSEAAEKRTVVSSEEVTCEKLKVGLILAGNLVDG